MLFSHMTERFDINIVDSFNAYVSYIDIFVDTDTHFAISNLRLPLRECIKNTKESVSFITRTLVLILMFKRCLWKSYNQACKSFR